MAKAPTPTITEKEEPKAQGYPAQSVFVQAKTTGKRGSFDCVPLHELPLLQRRSRASGESVVIIGMMNDDKLVVRGETMESLKEMFDRLTERYTYLPEGAKEGDKVSLVATMYGTEREGLKSMAITMRAMYKGYLELVKSVGKRPIIAEDIDALVSNFGPERTLESELLELGK